jgi:hypothetical protein
MRTGHAIGAAPDIAGPLQLAPGTAAVPATAIKTTSDASAILSLRVGTSNRETERSAIQRA